jgi:tripartite-type tricarboxylate transporter receptor subunit TctC
MRKLNIRLVAMTVALGLMPAGASRAQDAFPSRAVRIVVPYPAGGGTDILGRFVADQLSRKWGQSVLVENVGGAAGNIGAAAVARAAPDGYTLMVAAPGPIATNHFLYRDVPYDPTKLTPLALLTTGPYVLVVRKDFPASNVKELIAYAKANPGKLAAATPGIGGIAHLAAVQLEMLTGIKTLTVPYRGLAPAVNDLVAGHVDLMFDTPTTSLSLHRDGKVRMIATATPTRERDFPEIPTIAETVPGYRTITWYALVGPPQMPTALADRINRDVNEFMARPDIVERVRAIQMEPVTQTRAEAAKFFADESELWGKVIKAANLPLQ